VADKGLDDAQGQIFGFSGDEFETIFTLLG